MSWYIEDIDSLVLNNFNLFFTQKKWKKKWKSINAYYSKCKFKRYLQNNSNSNLSNYKLLILELELLIIKYHYKNKKKWYIKYQTILITIQKILKKKQIYYNFQPPVKCINKVLFQAEYSKFISLYPNKLNKDNKIMFISQFIKLAYKHNFKEKWLIIMHDNFFTKFKKEVIIYKFGEFNIDFSTINEINLFHNNYEINLFLKDLYTVEFLKFIKRFESQTQEADEFKWLSLIEIKLVSASFIKVFHDYETFIQQYESRCKHTWRLKLKSGLINISLNNNKINQFIKNNKYKLIKQLFHKSYKKILLKLLKQGLRLLKKQHHNIFT